MKLSKFLVSSVASLASARLPPNASDPVSQQLLDGLHDFAAGDAFVSALKASITTNRDAIDQVARAGRSHSGAQKACHLLNLVLPDYYTDASNPEAYTILRTKNWSDNCDLPAACYLTPEAPVQVAAALLIITLSRSKFAVRTAGHNPNLGFSSVGQEGVTIDTERFSELSLNADKTVATIGAGLRFGAVQKFLDSQGVAVVSGRNNQVGVSGLLLGGGHPIINSWTGLAADQIASAHVVTADFKVVTASPTVNSDLFRALKGGGNNFGVVVKWELRTVMPRNIWYRIANYANLGAREVLDAFVQVQKNMEFDPKAGIAVTCSRVGFNVAFVYAEPARDPAVFAPFRALIPVQETTPQTNGTVVGFIDLQSPAQGPARRDTSGVTVLPDTQLYLDSYHQYLMIAQAHTDTNTTFLMPIQTFGSAAAAIAEQNGGNVMGISARAQGWINPIVQWTDPGKDGTVHAILGELTDHIKTNAVRRGLYDPYIFSNIASHDQRVMTSYGERNLRFIRKISHKYDPWQTFQRLQNGGFLVSKA